MKWKKIREESRREEKDEEEGIGREEVRKVIRKLKNKKTMRGDGIPNEV